MVFPDPKDSPRSTFHCAVWVPRFHLEIELELGRACIACLPRHHASAACNDSEYRMPAAAVNRNPTRLGKMESTIRSRLEDVHDPNRSALGRYRQPCCCADRRRHLDRFRHTGFPRTAGCLDTQSCSGEDVGYSALCKRSRGPQGGLASEAHIAGMACNTKRRS